MLKIEVVAYYPFTDFKPVKNPKAKGTIHIKLPEFSLHIRGIICVQCAKKWRFVLPYYQAFDYRTKKKVSYPHLSFDSKAERDIFMKELDKKGNDWLKKSHEEKKDKKKVSP